jgi:hypothetical protein
MLTVDWKKEILAKGKELGDKMFPERADSGAIVASSLNLFLSVDGLPGYPTAVEQDNMLYWENVYYGSEHFLLAEVAMGAVGCSAAEAGCERLFRQLGMDLTDLKTEMSPDVLFSSIVLKQNVNFV